MDPLIRVPALSRTAFQLRRNLVPHSATEPPDLQPVVAFSVGTALSEAASNVGELQRLNGLSERDDEEILVGKTTPDAPFSKVLGDNPESILEISEWQGEKNMREAELAAIQAAKEEASAQGFTEGVREGRAEAAGAMKLQLDRLNSIAEQLRHVSAQALERAEDDVVAVVYACVCRVLGFAAPERGVVAGIVSQVVAHAKSRDNLIIRVHPGDFALLQENPDPGLAQRAPQAIWRPDSSIELGGCIIETTTGTLDARLELQLEAVRATLLKTREERANARVDAC